MKDFRLAEYLQLILKLKSKIPQHDFKWVPRSANNHVESLANLGAATKFQFRREIPVEHIINSSIQQLTGEVLCLDTSPGWSPIIAYLKDGTLPDDIIEARKLQHLATRYILLGDMLYKKSYSNPHSDPYLRCLSPEEAQRVMQESTTEIAETT